MNLEKIIQGIQVVGIHGDSHKEIHAVHIDSRLVETNDVFVALRGTQSDGHRFIPQVVENGAAAIVCESLPGDLAVDVCYIQVNSTRDALAILAGNYYGNPSSKLKLVGVTGTNGKTTVATLLFNLFRSMGYQAGLISTIIYRINYREEKSTHTTPDVLTLNRLLSQMVAEGCEYCFMEVSSHAIDQQRIDGLTFDAGLFTNITHDHLDYHKSFRDYLYTKKRFFDLLPSGAVAIINADDKNSRIMVQNCRAKSVSFGLKSMADHKARVLELHLDGMLMQIDNHEVWVQLTGKFNASNILAIYTTALHLHIAEDELLRGLSALQAAPGRFEVIRSSREVFGIVDYAHTPDAVENVLKTVQQINKDTGRIFCVLGAGGNRDKTKRPEMAGIAAKYSNLVVLTSDNPRNEDPEEIIRDMEKGLPPDAKYLSIVNRREAIKAACTMAQKGDIVLVCGKGHEDYQEIQGVRHHFDDREEIRKCFNLDRGLN